MTGTHLSRNRVGELRPSQLLWSNGIGMVVDLPQASVIVLGVDDWDKEYAEPVAEPRLLRAVRAELGNQVQELRRPPSATPVGLQDRAAELVGVPVAPFPRWLVCPYCRMLAPVTSGLFQMKVPYRRPEEVTFVHANCGVAKSPAALPVRFLVACPKGHLDDFPWVEYVHKGRSCGRPQLSLSETGPSGQIAAVFVKCQTCGKSRSMTDAFGDEKTSIFHRCTGRLPHLRSHDREPCQEQPRPILLGASNIWFPRVYSALSIPEASGGGLKELVQSHWGVLNEIEDPSELRVYRRTYKRLLVDLWEHADNEIWEAIESHRNDTDADDDGRVNVKLPEWEVFTSSQPIQDDRDFQLRQVDVPDAFRNVIESVVLVERLREVRAFVGFNRIQSRNDFGDISGDVGSERLTPISERAPEWVPATDVRGEGIFIRFNEDAVRAWEDRVGSEPRSHEYQEARRQRLIDRNQLQEAAENDPNLLRKTLLHSFSHAVMRQLALESGYAMASLTERIYSLPPTDPDGPMAGILIYTAATDSEGTLGGLIRLGEPELFGPTLVASMRAMEICASDPLCAEHPPDTMHGRELHGAACHACLFAPETSCEMGNSWLDRTLLVETLCTMGMEIWKSDQSRHRAVGPR